ncbi:hypothetical protein SRHO_G00329560 [Serrasalmus rhombeus]
MPSKRKKNKRRMRRAQAQRRALEEQHATAGKGTVGLRVYKGSKGPKATSSETPVVKPLTDPVKALDEVPDSVQQAEHHQMETSGDASASTQAAVEHVDAPAEESVEALAETAAEASAQAVVEAPAEETAVEEENISPQDSEMVNVEAEEHAVALVVREDSAGPAEQEPEPETETESKLKSDDCAAEADPESASESATQSIPQTDEHTETSEVLHCFLIFRC